MKNINEINNSAYVFKKNYHKIRVGIAKCEDQKDEINLPLNKLIKFNAVAISNRLIIEKECLYEMNGLKNRKNNW